MNTPSLRNTGPDAPMRTQASTPERLGYFVAGDGATVVLLHSSLGSKMQWSALAERLVRYRVIAIDLCGYGDNALPARTTSFSLDDEVRLVHDRLERLVPAGTPVHVVGHSYGGLVALRLAQSQRVPVASLALFEPVAFALLRGDAAALAEVRRIMALVSRLVAAGHRYEAAQTFVDFWSGAGAFSSLPLPTQASLTRRVDKLPLDFRAACSWPVDPDELRAIVAPTLLLTGQRSPNVVQRIHRVLMRMLPHTRIATFDCGHMGPVTDAHRINPWIEAFVEACAGHDAAPLEAAPGLRGIACNAQ